MALYGTLTAELKDAMKAGNAEKRDTLRMLQSAVKNLAIEKRVSPEELSDADVESVIKRLVKQRKDSIEQYRAGGREDLAAKEEAELSLLSAYLPEALPEAELTALVEAALKEGGFTEKSQIGQAMGAAMQKVAGRASGDDVRRLVMERLQ
ncbi:MAG: hypothetical protein A2808_01650 [Candidatus Moranbacteria bacterium RIFCSPHIGHO2_01_FULL_55_24]|nr:MAG: hypothetical protein A2808_01650 [Candidatus Moranbacteria bacterium RIFCSPHIGHO2_01_FULL_55_24]